jgi:hypothetical protein
MKLRSVGNILLLVAFFGLASRVSLAEKFEFSGLFIVALAVSAAMLAYLGTRLVRQRSLLVCWLILVTITLVMVISVRTSGTLKNALIFWPVLLPLLLKRCPWDNTLKASLDLLWVVALILVFADVLTLSLQDGLAYALFGPAYRLVFSERTWVSLLFALYALHYLIQAQDCRSRRTRLLLKAAVSMTIAVITQSFAVALALAITVPLLLTRSLVARVLIAAIFLASVPLASIAFGDLIDLKMQNRAVALFDELGTSRNAIEILFGLQSITNSTDYELLPGVPEIGLNSFSLPFFLLNNFGVIGLVCYLVVFGVAIRRAREVPAVLVATNIVSFLHPVHLQLEFMLLSTLLTLTRYPQSMMDRRS